mmetsp:Transcript_1678/g.2471  ORF Transcript_1678/g.2471 Transcript_1678/m.2471 type:complete len:717 (+) Transcript_1678:107-2257(+)|eukprot:CAMPEP_0194223700 /NCGR_PEP_ID=MMETSP0156-20130528/35734_1 /TAXON_ID=33649 /ORGANISM="Thalassionema nitzschioides, Strain L26-B" /LENGTH=716 /DNA_ID=CAMNT_0038954939 /DNA_START=52 /DNA_END=2202 /DNA_ORIENTATION=+
MHRRGGKSPEKTEDLPLHSGKNGNKVKTKRKERSTFTSGISYRRAKQMAVMVKYLSYAIFTLIVILVLILRFDTKDRVRLKVVNLKNKVLGNSQRYMDHPRLQTLFQEHGKEGAVNGDYYVFCTVSNLQQEETHVGKGRSSISAEDALRNAQAQLPRKTNPYPYVKIDIVTGIKRFEEYNYYSELSNLPSRWFGLALNWEDDWVFLPEEVYANTLVDKHMFLRWERIGLYAAKSGRSEGAFSLPDFSDDGTVIDYVDVFHTESVMLDRSSTQPKPTAVADANAIALYHGHRMSTLPELVDNNGSLLLNRAKDAGGYLAQIVKDSGRQVYKYHPRSDYEPLGYNMARHAGTLYAMTIVYRNWNEKYLEESMRLSLDYLAKTIEDCPIPNAAISKVKEKKAKCSVDYETKQASKISKLGVNAMAILAICEHLDAVPLPSETVKGNVLQVVFQLARYVRGSWLDEVSSEGGMKSERFIHKIHLDKETNNLIDMDLDYSVRSHYGEVSFALARMVTLAQKNRWNVLLKDQDDWLEMSTKAAFRMISFDMEVDEPDFTFDHWLLYAINELDTLLPETPYRKYKQLFLQYAIRSVQIARRWQTIEDKNPDDLDQLGIYYDDLSSTSTAIKSEGLCAILPLLKGEDHIQKVALDTALLSLKYQLQTQYQAETAMYMRNPQRILGGFASSIISSDLRNDATSHNVASLLCIAQYSSHYRVAKTF